MKQVEETDFQKWTIYKGTNKNAEVQAAKIRTRIFKDFFF